MSDIRVFLTAPSVVMWPLGLLVCRLIQLTVGLSSSKYSATSPPSLPPPTVFHVVANLRQIRGQCIYIAWYYSTCSRLGKSNQFHQDWKYFTGYFKLVKPIINKFEQWTDMKNTKGRGISLWYSSGHCNKFNMNPGPHSSLRSNTFKETWDHWNICCMLD